jgi:hypothetical protein
LLLRFATSDAPLSVPAPLARWQLTAFRLARSVSRNAISVLTSTARRRLDARDGQGAGGRGSVRQHAKAADSLSAQHGHLTRTRTRPEKPRSGVRRRHGHRRQSQRATPPEAATLPMLAARRRLLPHVCVGRLKTRRGLDDLALERACFGARLVRRPFGGSFVTDHPTIFKERA